MLSHSLTLCILLTSLSPMVLQEKHPFKATWFSQSMDIMGRGRSKCLHKHPQLSEYGKKMRVNETETPFQESPEERSAVKQACQRLSSRSVAVDIQAKNWREGTGDRERKGNQLLSLPGFRVTPQRKQSWQLCSLSPQLPPVPCPLVPLGLSQHI